MMLKTEKMAPRERWLTGLVAVVALAFGWNAGGALLWVAFVIFTLAGFTAATGGGVER